MLHLDEGQRLLALRVHRGGAAHVELPLRTVIADALRLGSTGLIIAHNHPGGDPTPSAEDLRVSRLLADTGRNLGIRLIDHLIFARGGVCSLQERGLI